MPKVRITASPRLGDPKPQQDLWIGMVLSVVNPDPNDDRERLGEGSLWVATEEVIEQIEEKGDKNYADFFRWLSNTPGGREAPGLIISPGMYEFLD